MIKHILLDFDGVIRLYDNTELFDLEKKHGLAPRTFFSYSFHPDILTPAITGKITDTKWRKNIVQAFATDYPDLPAEEFLSWLTHAHFRIHTELFELLDTTFPNIPLYLGTNGTDKVPNDLKKMNLTNKFASIFNSSTIGVAKPDVRYYEHVVEALGCEYSEILYIDDSKKNIAQAQSLGIHVFCFRNNFLDMEVYISNLRSIL